MTIEASLIADKQILPKKKFRIYADTSVFGGCFDEEFAEDSKALFELIKKGVFRLIIAPATLRELDKAPENVQQILADLPPEAAEIIEYSEEIGELRNAYLKAGIVGSSWKEVV